MPQHKWFRCLYLGGASVLKNLDQKEGFNYISYGLLGDMVFKDCASPKLSTEKSVSMSVLDAESPALLRHCNLVVQVKRRAVDTPRLWSPLSLRRSALLSFLVLFLLLIIALALLFHISTRDGHLVSVDQRFHYIWVYGPTASGENRLFALLVLIS